MQVVLLAAGMGLRLGHLTRATPKALIALNGQALIDYTLAYLLSNKRVSEVLVVGGFGFDRLESHLTGRYSAFGDRLRLVYNGDFTKGNISTLGAALPYLEEDFLICNVDHLFQQDTWTFILQERPNINLFCDFFRDFEPDEMKVLLDEERKFFDISKKLTNYDCAYVGLTYIPKSDLNHYNEAFNRTCHEIGDEAVVENVLPYLSRLKRNIQIVPFDRFNWYEVDTRQDLAKAEAALSQGEGLNWMGLAPRK